MKKIIYTLLFFQISSHGWSQQNIMNVCCSNAFYFDFNAAPDSSSFYFYFDSTQTNNIWQIGNVSKQVFTSGSHGPRALVTDTVNPYPVNNTSSFQIVFANCPLAQCGGGYHGPAVYIYHKMDTDFGHDGGTIDVSHDNGMTWINILQDNWNAWVSMNLYSINDTVSSVGVPGFSGYFDWQQLILHHDGFVSSDTTIMRFTFSSDSVMSSKDGWMIGQVHVETIMEGVEEYGKDNLVLSPNPATNLIRIESLSYFTRGKIETVEIFNTLGEKFFSNAGGFRSNAGTSRSNAETINVSKLTSGIYFVRVRTSDGMMAGKFVKE